MSSGTLPTPSSNGAASQQTDGGHAVQSAGLREVSGTCVGHEWDMSGTCVGHAWGVYLSLPLCVRACVMSNNT